MIKLYDTEKNAENHIVNQKHLIPVAGIMVAAHGAKATEPFKNKKKNYQHKKESN